MTKLLTGLLLSCIAGASHAGIIYNIENGNLVSASGVELNGVEYNVLFGHSCSSMYDGCDESLFTFTTQNDATAALDALFAQVLVDNVNIAGIDYDFLSKPVDIFSCDWELGGNGNRDFCELWVPYNVEGQTLFSAWYSHENGVRASTILSSGSTLNYGDNNDFMAFTRWEVAREVPEPSSLALFGVGMLGLGAWRRRQLKTDV